MTDAKDIRARRAARRATERGLEKTIPGTQHVLVRSKREDIDGVVHASVSIVDRDSFNFTDYRFFRISPASHAEAVEEWVHKDELEYYQRTSV